MLGSHHSPHTQTIRCLGHLCFTVILGFCFSCGNAHFGGGRRSFLEPQPEKPSQLSSVSFEINFLKRTKAIDLKGQMCVFEKGTKVKVRDFEEEQDKWLELHLVGPLKRCHGSEIFLLARSHIQIEEISSPHSLLPTSQQKPPPPQRRTSPRRPSENFSSDYVNRKPHKQLFFPLAELPLDDYTIEGRGFGAMRAGGRKHAANDLLEYGGQGVYAVTSGQIIDYYYFYQGTDAIVVDHYDFVVRYGEVSSMWADVKIKSKVQPAQKIGIVGTLWSGYSMLHFEKYTGELSGPLSVPQNYPYKRRADLVNPTSFLRYLENHLP